jgi:phthalate 3,4-dioxygenase ferredoxin reductase subunit
VRGTHHELVGELSGEKPQAAALYTDPGTGLLHGAVTVNWPKALVQCRRLVTQAAGFDEALDKVRGLTTAPAAPTPATTGQA